MSVWPRSWPRPRSPTGRPSAKPKPEPEPEAGPEPETRSGPDPTAGIRPRSCAGSGAGDVEDLRVCGDLLPGSHDLALTAFVADLVRVGLLARDEGDPPLMGAAIAPGDILHRGVAGGFHLLFDSRGLVVVVVLPTVIGDLEVADRDQTAVLLARGDLDLEEDDLTAQLDRRGLLARFEIAHGREDLD